MGGNRGASGTGNTSADPQFQNRAGGNYRLAAASPGCNTGTNQDWMADATDLMGAPRIYGSITDMGAFELQAPDTDGDGIPDDWETANGLNPAVSNSPSANADEDWMTDLQEYWANTQPTNKLSVFPPAVAATASPDALSIMVDPTSADRVYSIHGITNLLDSPLTWTLYPPEQTGTGSAVTFTVTNNASGCYYRTRVRLP